MVKISQPELGQDIKKHRLALGWTQTELAEKAGTTQAHIAKIESGAYNPKGDTTQRIYDALGVKFVVKNASYEINARLELLVQSTGDAIQQSIRILSDKVDKILKKLGIRD